ncbi:MAG: hypothetical protein CVU34_11865 [Betaproteobacteria bacterium HGW-Betaproteobacteria-7]|nr:MAG: hypothetical protein CVU34_11865 [Betaproteobacteria bacterium HGW-Betaproteobacteria-7]
MAKANLDDCLAFARAEARRVAFQIFLVVFGYRRIASWLWLNFLDIGFNVIGFTFSGYFIDREIPI